MGVEILLVASIFMPLKPDISAGLIPGPLGSYADFTLLLLWIRSLRCEILLLLEAPSDFIIVA